MLAAVMADRPLMSASDVEYAASGAVKDWER